MAQMQQQQQQQRGTLSRAEVVAIGEQLSCSKDPVLRDLGKSLFVDNQATHDGFARKFNTLTEGEKIRVYDYLRNHYEELDNKGFKEFMHSSLRSFLRVYYRGELGRP